jgi:hypothetical protein
VALAAGGLGLFGTGVHGLAKLDGRLAEAADGRPAVREVKLAPGAPHDCPWRDRRQQRRL